MDFIQVIIFMVIIAVAIVQQIKKAGKAEKVTSPKEVLADMFPPIEEEEKPATPARPAHKLLSTRKQEPPVTARVQTVRNPKQADTKTDPKAEKLPIKLSTKEEARRAFIYSEIFNRKY